VVYSGLKKVLPRSDFQASVSYNLVVQIIKVQRVKSRGGCRTHSLGDATANFPTPHFCLDLDPWEHFHNNVTSMATSLKIQERINLLVTQCLATGHCEIYAGNKLANMLSPIYV